MPFTVLVGAMVCYLSLSRRLELVVARSAGMSAWQFIAPAIVIALLIGIGVTTVYNPISANFANDRNSSKPSCRAATSETCCGRRHDGFWLRQRNEDGQSIINAGSSRQQGVELSDVSIFTLDHADGHSSADRGQARDAASPATGGSRMPAFTRADAAAASATSYDLKTNLTPAQVSESFATPETVPFWQLSSLIDLAENAGLAAAGYRLQYYQLLALPFYLVAMVLLAAAVSLRLFRLGGVQKMVLGGVVAGFLLYVLSKVSGDLSKASLLAPAVAAMLPAIVGGRDGLFGASVSGGRVMRFPPCRGRALSRGRLSGALPALAACWPFMPPASSTAGFPLPKASWSRSRNGRRPNRP